MLRAAKRRLEEILRNHPEIREGSASLEIRTLSPQEALGDPEGRDEFPLIRGKEKLVEATYEGQVGQAFTACPSSWSGTVGEWLRLDPEDLAECPLVLSGLNALARHLGLVTEATRHCRDEGPAQCARTMEGRIRERLGEEGCLLQVGLQPAILKAAVRALGPARVRVLDLQPENVGRKVEGVLIRDGEHDFEESLWGVRLVLVTGSTWANGTFGEIARRVKREGADLVLYGTTAAGPAALMGLERWCFEAE